MRTEKTSVTLGDKWESFDGKLNKDVVDAKTSSVIFSLLLLLSGACSSLIVIGIHYLVFPRLSQWGFFGSLISVIFFALALLIIIAVAFFQVAAVAGFSKPVYVFYSLLPTFILGALPELLRGMFGISTDRLGNSFVGFHNKMIRGLHLRVKPDNLLILLPRCISKEQREEVISLARERGCTCIVAAGGEMARDKVKALSPKAVIAVACERDLQSGILEVMKKVPVVGVANTRPNGPCVQTRFDVHEVRLWLDYFLSR